VRKEVELLEHHADYTARGVDRGLAVAHPVPSHDDLAGPHALEVVDAADQSGFSGTRRAAENDLFALRDGEVDVLERVETSVPFLDFAHFDHRFGATQWSSGIVVIGHVGPFPV
jgi:hypothetical protein